jgi:hypothetical protein
VDTYLSLDSTHRSLLTSIAEQEANLDEMQTEFKLQSERLVEARMLNTSAGHLAD